MKVLIVGCASEDTLHNERGQWRRTARTIGGAGLYTALAAAAMAMGKVDVSLFAPRPHPLPEQFAEAARFIEWFGPQVDPDAMPKLEIVHHGNGSATLLSASWGSEAELQSAPLLPRLAEFDLVHIAALSSAERQIEFLRVCRENEVKISAGTYARIAYGDTDRVRHLLKGCDFFFMNNNEANALVQNRTQAWADGHEVYITDGQKGVTIYHGTEQMLVPAQTAEEIDATGAGDSFCGAVLVSRLLGASPEEAARDGCRIAAKCISHVGPQGLLNLLRDPGC
jgi:sugar/nucleoside kinase (ribokinase family)